jgi:hypothetical protein
MDDQIKKKFEFVKSDISCKDINHIPFLSDVESIAFECIKTNHKSEGFDLLITFGRMMERKNNEGIIKEFLIMLNAAERVLS